MPFRTLTLAIVLPFLLFVFPTRSLAQEGPQIAETQSILRRAAALVPEIESSQRPSAAANVARLQVLAGDLEGALSTSQTASGGPDQLAIDSIAWALGAKGNLPLALQLIADQTQGSDKANSYWQLAQQRAARGDFQSAVTIAQMIRGDPEQNETFVAALMSIYRTLWMHDRQGAAQVVKQAVALANDQARADSTPRHLTAGMYLDIVRALGETGNRTDAAGLVVRIRELAERAQDAGEKHGMLMYLGQAEAASGEFSAALETAEKLRQGNQHDAILQEIASVRAGQGDADGALEVAAALSEPGLRLAHIREVVDRLAASNNYSRALEIVDSIPLAKDRAYALAQLALQQAGRKDPAAAFTVQRAWETAMGAKPEAEHFVFEHIAVTRGMLGDFSGALAMVDGMNAESRVWPLWNLTDMMVRSGKKEQALDVANSEESPHAKVYALMGIANGLLEQAQRTKQAQGSR